MELVSNNKPDLEQLAADLATASGGAAAGQKKNPKEAAGAAALDPV